MLFDLTTPMMREPATNSHRPSSPTGVMPGIAPEVLQLRYLETPERIATAVILVDDQAVGELDVQVCSSCRVGTIEYIRIDPTRRRCGYATRAVQQLLEETAGFSWTLTPIANTPAAQALWRSVGLQNAVPAHDLKIPR